MSGEQAERLYVEQETGWCSLDSGRCRLEGRDRIERAIHLNDVKEAGIPPQPLLGRHRLARVKLSSSSMDLSVHADQTDPVIRASAFCRLVEDDRRFHARLFYASDQRPARPH